MFFWLIWLLLPATADALGACGCLSLPTIVLPCITPPVICLEELGPGPACEAACCSECAARRKAPRRRTFKGRRPSRRRRRPRSARTSVVDNQDLAEWSKVHMPTEDYQEYDLVEEEQLQEPEVDENCNSPRLRKIIKRGVGARTSSLKHSIQLMAEKELGAEYNVLCGRGQFSYTTTTDEYCQEMVHDKTCYVFKRNLELE